MILHLPVFCHYSTGKDQYLGVSEAGIGGRVIVGLLILTIN